MTAASQPDRFERCGTDPTGKEVRMENVRAQIRGMWEITYSDT